MHVQMAYSREQIERGEVVINHTPGVEQLADTLTKATTVEKFINTRSKLMASRITLGLLSLLTIMQASAFKFETISPIVYKPTSHVIQLGISSYVIDYTFMCPCDEIPKVQHMAQVAPNLVQPIENLATKAFHDDCKRSYEASWLLKLSEIQVKQPMLPVDAKKEHHSSS